MGAVLTQMLKVLMDDIIQVVQYTCLKLWAISHTVSEVSDRRHPCVVEQRVHVQGSSPRTLHCAVVAVDRTKNAVLKRFTSQQMMQDPVHSKPEVPNSDHRVLSYSLPPAKLVHGARFREEVHKPIVRVVWIKR